MLAALTMGGCSKHDCDLSSADDQKTFGDIAEMTKGAHSCDVTNGELHATHYDANVDDVTAKYTKVLESKSYKVEVSDHDSTRANGKPLHGKLIVAEVSGKKMNTLVYLLTDGIVETVSAPAKD
jgi:hypothetical protein